MSNRFVEGAVKYPDGLPCPQIETDLTPRERRYISDIGQVKKLRTFQRDYQATRQNISFVFTPEQARVFQLWYKDEIIEGGAWFYADWPILHKETDIAYRFVTRPVWRVLALGNFHVSASVELYEGRKVGKYITVHTSKLYPLLPIDRMSSQVIRAWTNPEYALNDAMTSAVASFTGSGTEWIYSQYALNDAMTSAVASFTGSIDKWVISYDFYDEDAASLSVPVIIAGEMT